jgi:hypothetical protein
MARTFVLVLEVTDDGGHTDKDQSSQPETPGYLLTAPDQAGRYIKHTMDLDAGITVRVVWAVETLS